MSKYVLLVGMFFLCVVLMCPPSVYPQDEEEPTRSDQLPVGATLPSTQSTANIDMKNAGLGEDPLSGSRVMTDAEQRAFQEKLAIEKAMRERLGPEFYEAGRIMKEFSDALHAAQGLEWNEAAGEYLPPGTIPTPEQVKKETVRKTRLFAPQPSGDDNWDFLPDFIPGVSVYENMPEMPVTPVAPEAVPSSQKGQAPASGKSDGSGRAQDQDKNLGPDLFVQ
ncbi:MAG: hypothetical protein A3I73_03440 [Omnitrophica bacterium RIFCSPLOWO2_02_FULL_45_16]|nr:MAG: hypothetical protein A3C51_04050 [Omnitrophica bacterium RIFCSPHIGHO2_02_FULL_46_20]OGW99698.1 MAG: hypothetical protein A3I73_03440 [Omnitrophica bacterium RIFCSPLOWO2_02_FULL_45_16]